MAEETTEQRIARLGRDFGASMQQIAHSLSDIEGVQFEQGALLKEHGRALVSIRKRLDTIENRLDGMDERMATKADIAQVLASFQQVLAVLDERLPGKE